MYVTETVFGRCRRTVERDIGTALRVLAIGLLLSLLPALPAAAQDKGTPADNAAAPSDSTDTSPDSAAATASSTDTPSGGADTSATAPQTPPAGDIPVNEAITRLEYIQNTLTTKLHQRKEIGDRIEEANEQEKEDLRARARDINASIAQLRKTIESISTGGADASLFTSADAETVAETETNWQKDLTLIAQPVIDSLKELTEKPRRINALKDKIARYQREFDEAEKAIANLEPKLNAAGEGELSLTLDRLLSTWQDRRDDAESSIRIAEIEIAELQGDRSFFASILDSIRNFITGRGFTLLLALLAGMGVWHGLKFLLKGYRQSLVDKSRPESRTRYRLIEYSTHALTGLLILLAVFIVFHQRGDVLLLGLLILLLFGVALAARTLLPRYLTEARLLLNIGPMRETERVFYRNLPWRVESINAYTVFHNPELHGALKIPIAELHGYVSRPSGDDPWFPTSRGDSILLEDGTWLEVLSQNPDTVTVAEDGGQTRNYASSDFYTMTMTNLSRAGQFAVRSGFGVDYDLRSISTTEVPKALREAIRTAITESDIGDFLKALQVEIESAGASSIDYWILATFDSRAARSQPRIRRMIQKACVDCCTDRGWDFPFQRLALAHRQGPDTGSARGRGPGAESATEAPDT
ncbi:MAG: hypothetical protein CSB44_10585 [Gammaproteobacteria bacterium]|nr:MAG: hypothetical protein CSB44_10585 [Gammaproteobacteria bacterium]